MSVLEDVGQPQKNLLFGTVAYWLILWGVYLLVFLLFGRMLLGLGKDGFDLPVMYELLPFLGEVFYAFLLIVFLFLPLDLLVVFIFGKHARRHVYIKGIRYLLTMLLVVLITSSSLLYKLSGSFAGVEAVRMFLNDTVQMVQHAVHFYSLQWVLLVIFAVLVVTWLLMRILLWVVGKVADRTVLKTAMLLFLAVLFGFNGTRLASSFSDYMIVEEFGQTYELADFLKQKQLKAGPFSFLAEDLIFQILPVYNHVDLSSFRIHRNRQIPMTEYLQGRKAPPRKYDVIVLLIESLRPDQLRAFGGKRDVMPNLDQVARQSVRFHRAYAQSSHSNYADVVPLSSHYPLRDRRTHFYPRDPVYPRVLLHDILKPLGYKTAIISSQNEYWGGMLNYYDTGNLDHVFHSANAGYSTRAGSSPHFESEEVERWMTGGKKSGKIDDSMTVSEAIRWIEGLASEQPYGLYMNLQNSHLPFEVPDGFPRRFLDVDEETARRFKAGKLVGLYISDIKDAYADSLFYIDYQLGKLIDFLKQSGRWDHTLLVVSADTSTFFNGAFVGNGGRLDDEVVHVPLFIKAPGMEQGDDGRLVQHVDVLPTITGILGLGQHPSFQGIDLFDKTAYRENRAIYLVAQSPVSYQYGMMKEGWKIVYDVRSRKYQLYREPDLQRDVLASHVDVAEVMARQLHAWVELQLGYYSSREEMKEYYPPVIVD